MTDKILHNIRILDFTWVLAGPYATRLLADFGAEVIKVQPLLSPEGKDAFARGYYNTWNRNKLGITLNLDNPQGINLIKTLVVLCDGVIENFTPHVMANWGLDYENLKKIKPDIIMVSMSALGQGSNYSGFASTVHALSGLTQKMSLDGKPVGPGFSYADHISGLYASLSLLAALEHRKQTGEGQYIDLSETALMAGLLKEKETLKAPDNIYPCRGENKWCAISADAEVGWRGLKLAMRHPAWAENIKFATPERRITNKEELDKLIAAWTRERSAEEVMTLLQQHGVRAGVVQDAADLARDPQLKARGFFVTDGEAPFIDAVPVKMENSGPLFNRAAPSPGCDNDYVYGTLLGLSKKEIRNLKKNGVI
jgi:crotonobetainyl-CoA:carnitine CoA-transferase CaiB-like acyl-CoA transferase